MIFAASSDRKYGPRQLIAITRSKSPSSRLSSISPRTFTPTPALLTSRSIRPQASIAASRMRLRSGASAILASASTHSTPLSSNSFRVSSAGSTGGTKFTTTL